MLQLNGEPLTLPQIRQVSLGKLPVALSVDALSRMKAGREVIERILAQHQVVYGVNTGFGKLSDVRIADSELLELQLNLVRSHACGVGEPLSEPETRAMLLLRANVLAIGCSGARPIAAQTLVQMLEEGVHPIIPSKGSVGASGDLAPLAHLALVAIGEGEAVYQGRRMPGGQALSEAGIEPLALQAKEGLALLNGTQAMGAVGGLALEDARFLAGLADVAGAMTLEALLGTPVAFDSRIQAVRPHPGQVASAEHLRQLLEGSEIRQSHLDGDSRVQDAYCLRCMPQVHGAVRGALEHAREIVEIESGSATDNPLVFGETGDVLSGGNFHGAPLGLVFDYAAIALTDLISISERRIDRLINPDANEHLPAFLARNAGACSGFMMAQVTAAALLNESKVLSHPASSDSVPTSGGKEDHVSMGMTSALKLRQIVQNLRLVLAIELIAAAEGIEHRRPLKSGLGVERAHAEVRQSIPPLEIDRPLGPDIEKLAAQIAEGAFGDLIV